MLSSHMSGISADFDAGTGLTTVPPVGKHPRMAKTKDQCPCGSGDSYERCCGRFIEGGQLPQTAEQLMRSRYAAYARFNGEYLLATWHVSTRPQGLQPEPQAKWIGLKIVRTEDGGPTDESGVVEFLARYKVNGRACRLREASRFKRENGRWYYVDADG